MPTNGEAVKIAHYTRSKFNSLTNKDNATIYYVKESNGEIKQYIGNTPVVSDFTESDPTVPSHVKSISSGNISSWNNKFNTPTGTTSQYVRGNGSLATFPSIPSKVSDLTNDSDYTDKTYVDNMINGVAGNFVDNLNTKVDKVSGKVLSTNDYTTAEKNKLSGIEPGAGANVQSNWNATAGDAFILNKPYIPTKTSDLTNDSNYTTYSELNSEIGILAGYVDGGLNNKVDKVNNKGLSTEDYTTTEKNKLSGIETGAQVNVGTNLSQGARSTTTLRIDSSTGNNLTLPAVTTSLAGLMTSTDKTRLDVLHSLLEEDTSNNVVDSITEVLAIFNNYPEGADLVTALAGKVDKVSGKGLSTEDYTTNEKNKLIGIQSGAEQNRAIATKAEAEAGTINTKSMTPLRVKEAITANPSNFTTKTYVDGGDSALSSTIDSLADYVDSNLSTKQSTITGAATTIASSDLTASRALISNGSGKVAVSAVTSTELGYLDGVTSSIQDQLDNRLLASWTPSWGQVTGKPTWIGSSKPTYTKSDVGLGSVENKSSATIRGEIVAGNIPNLPASRITSGTMSKSRLPSDITYDLATALANLPNI